MMVQRVSAVVGSVMAVGLLVGAVVVDRQRTDAPAVEVIFADSDGLPDALAEGDHYIATFSVEWTGPVTMRNGSASVFVSRRGDTSEDAPEDGWPIVCESEFDEAIFKQWLSCPFQAPGIGEFALQLEVRNDEDVVIGDAIYTHIIVDPSTTSQPEPDSSSESGD